MSEADVSDTLVGRWTTCRPLARDDLPFAYALLTGPVTGWRLRYRGATPPFPEFAEHAWDDVLAQWVAVGNKSGAPKGMVILSSPNLLDGYAFVSVVATPEARGQGVMLEAAANCIDYTFLCWPLRKLCAEVMELNFESFRSGAGRYFEVEGCRRQQVYAAGRYRDVVQLAIFRDNWIRLRSPSEIETEKQP